VVRIFALKETTEEHRGEREGDPLTVYVNGSDKALFESKLGRARVA
jgi:hypothetical protein